MQIVVFVPGGRMKSSRFLHEKESVCLHLRTFYKCLIHGFITFIGPNCVVATEIPNTYTRVMDCGGNWGNGQSVFGGLYMLITVILLILMEMVNVPELFLASITS